MTSPVFTNNEMFRAEHRATGLAELERPMTFDGVLNKAIVLFSTMLAMAVVGWFFPAFLLPAAIVALVVGLIAGFKKEPSKPLIFTYAVLQGYVVGAFSQIMEDQYEGIVIQAVLGTFSVVLATFFLYKSGRFRPTPRLTKIFLVAMVGYLIFSLANFGLMVFGATDGMFGLRSQEVFGIPLGLILGGLAVLMGAYSLVLDFDFINNGVRNLMPERYEWTGVFGLLVTVIWLYIEILRIIAILRR